MTDGTDTWEITRSTKEQRDYIRFFIGTYCTSWERMDDYTFNLTVPEKASDTVVEWAEKHDLVCRLV